MDLDPPPADPGLESPPLLGSPSEPVAEPSPPEASPPEPVVAAGPVFELPTARQVVGRGLQLALDASRDVRRASLYVGFLLLAIVGPLVVLLVAELPRLTAFYDAYGNGFDAEAEAQAEALAGVFLALYAVGALAALGAIAAVVDGSLMAVALLGGRLVGRPMRPLEALRRARQVFWRYGGAAFAVGVLASIVSLVAQLIEGFPSAAGSLGGSLLASFLGTLVTAPFGYILTAIVLGDVGGATALRRSLVLARARPGLALVVAAFAFFAQAIQLFGLSAALDVVDSFVEVVHPTVDAGVDASILELALGTLAVVAYGSLTVTVGAIAAAPQVAAFVGLTHFSAGLDRARESDSGWAGFDGPADPVVPRPAVVSLPAPAEVSASTALLPSPSTGGPLPPPPTSSGVELPLGALASPQIVPLGALASPQVLPPPAPPPAPTRWITRPMLALIVLELLVVVVVLLGGG